MKNNTTKIIIIALIVAIVAFFAGKDYGSKPAAQVATGGFARGAAGTRTGATGGTRAGGGFVMGQVVKVETGDVVISTGTSGSEIILVSTSTPIMKTSAGTLADIAAGQTIQVTGSSNSDGSLSATSIQVRPTAQNSAQ